MIDTYYAKFVLILTITLTYTCSLHTGSTDHATPHHPTSPRERNSRSSSYLSTLMSYLSVTRGANNPIHQEQPQEPSRSSESPSSSDSPCRVETIQEEKQPLIDELVEEKIRDFFNTTQHKTFASLYRDIKALRPNIAIKSGQYVGAPLIPAQEMQALLSASFHQTQKKLSKAIWTGHENPHNHSLFFKESYRDDLRHHNYLAFVEKMVVSPESKIVLCGDLHGDVLSLGALINSLIQDGYLDSDLGLRQNARMLFLGDYVDRGNYGTECLYLLYQLQLKNPEKIILLRGNHEDINLACRYGFSRELFNKYEIEQAQRLQATIHRAYDFMPVALYLGCKDNESGITHYAHCCHAGIESRYSPKKLLADNQSHAYELLDPSLLEIKDPEFGITTKTFENMGFLWCDFNTDPQEATHQIKGRGRSLSKQETEELLNQQSTDSHRVFCVISAHQHGSMETNDMMKLIYNNDGTTPNHEGIAKLWLSGTDPLHNTHHLWQGAVVKFGVGPDNAHFNKWHCNNGFDLKYFTYGILTTAEKPNNWELNVRHLKFPEDIIPIQGKIG